MNFTPNSLILYVQDVDASTRFYRALLGAPPLETFPEFALFALQDNFHLGLQARDGIYPPPQEKVGGTELCFSHATDDEVDALCRAWVARGVTIVAPPTRLAFGYTFVAQDPDGHRLRVCATDVSSYQ